MREFYFIVLDEAPVKGSPTPKYELFRGDPDEAIGYYMGSATTIKKLVLAVPESEPVYRVFLQRTDGRTGKRLINRKHPLLEGHLQREVSETLTYESLNKEFRLQIIKTEDEYQKGLRLWEDRISPNTWEGNVSADVVEYAGLLALLLNRYEHEQEENL